MLDLFDKIYASKEKGFKPAVIFLDIEKAFDTGVPRGGIRYQVPDFTLVGGSFFLPKTQLVHGTNWWVYCPFSRKTVSTWY